MKKTRDIDVRLFRVVGDIAPFVMVDYIDKYAQEHSGLMLVDSGSTTNILSCEMADGIGMSCKMEDCTTISSISQETVNADMVQFSFALGGSLFHETFCISDRKLPIDIKGETVIGILGNQFMQDHQLVLDYSNFTLHTSKVSPDNLSIADCSFFFPMEIGLNFYGLPILSVKQNGKELVTLIDSGATGNMIAGKTLSDNKFRYQCLEEKDVMINVTGTVPVDEAIVWFNMLSLDKEDVCEISRYDTFNILPCNVFTPNDGECDTNGEQLPPIEVLIGAPFMAKEGWTLDFGAKIMYKLKAA